MNPALSVIFFTTLSGAGYGLLMGLGVWIFAECFRGNPLQGAMPSLWLASLCVGSVLVAVGLLSSMLHLGKPGRAWRAFSQWRTSWLSREGVMSLVTYVPVAGLLVLLGVAVAGLSAATSAPSLLPAISAAMAICAVVTVICTAMIYGSLKTIPAWQHQLVVPGYVAFALLTGGSLLAAMSSYAEVADPSVRSFAVVLAAIALGTAALKLAYWRAIDMQALPVTRAEAVGLPGRQITVFERPHTEESYITREMAFTVARKHSRSLRLIALVLFGVMPIFAAATAWSVATLANVAFPIAALTAFAGAFVERWLFFADARHVVTLYY